MTIYLTDDYLVEVDKHNFTLRKKIEESENYTTLGYFANMKQVLHRLIRTEVHDKNDLKLTFEEYLKKLNEVDALFNKLIDKLVIEKKLTRKELQEYGE